MATKVFGNFSHKWEFDLPWHMVDLRDWFYMVNVGFIEPIIFLHVRVCGIRSLWEYRIEPNPLRLTQNEAEAGEQKSPYCLPTQHSWKEEYYGYKCERCPMFIPYGSEPWLPVEE